MQGCAEWPKDWLCSGSKVVGYKEGQKGSHRYAAVSKDKRTTPNKSCWTWL